MSFSNPTIADIDCELPRHEEDSPLENTSSPTQSWGRIRAAMLKRFARIQHGQFELIDGEQSSMIGSASSRTSSELVSQVVVHDSQFYRDTVLGGTIGAAESYIAGHWSSTDLTGLLRLMARNIREMTAMNRVVSRFKRLAYRISHRSNRNTQSGSRRNIAQHYDLGNDFYQTFLDPTMNYSCGIFDAPIDSSDCHEGSAKDQMHAASQRKMQRIGDALRLTSADHVLEIGTGWGGMALFMATQFGCRVTTTTISQAQFDYASQLIRDAGMEHRVTVLLRDYRKLAGGFDKIVSVEMIEAVGHEFLDTFFRQCSDLLKPGGDMLIQTITMNEQDHRRYLKSVDFIRAYVFPGGCLPTMHSLTGSVGRATNMRLLQHVDITPHYATTLNCWKREFLSQLDQIRELGYDGRLIRLWHFYLCYCEAAFAERHVHCVQAIFSKPGSTLDPLPIA